MKLSIRTNTLTDGSKTHDVIMRQYDQIIELPAYDREHAIRLVGILGSAIDTHTADLVEFA